MKPGVLLPKEGLCVACACRESFAADDMGDQLADRDAFAFIVGAATVLLRMGSDITDKRPRGAES